MLYYKAAMINPQDIQEVIHLSVTGSNRQNVMEIFVGKITNKM